MNLFLLRITSDSGDAGGRSSESRVRVPPHLGLEGNESHTFHLATPEGGRISLHVWIEEKAYRGEREYIYDSGDEVVFYTGLAFHRDLGHCYVDAKAFRDDWASLGDRIDGRFAALRLDKIKRQVELLLDPVGLLNVYIFRGDGETLISNRLEAIRANASLSIDLEGLGSFIACGWYLADKTPFADVSVLPGGAVYRFGGDSAGPRQYFDRYDVIKRGYRPLPEVSTELIRSITPILRGLSELEGEIYCALTGGSDSRVLLCLLRHAGVQARYFTRYAIDTDDVEIPRQLATDFELDYRDDFAPVDSVLDDWNTFARRAMRTTDGSVNLWQFPDFLTDLFSGPRRCILIEGIDGAVQKNWSMPLISLLGLKGEDGLRRMVIRNTLDALRPEVYAYPSAWVREYLETNREQGVGLADAWAASHAFEELPRWGGAHATKWDAECDYPMLFLTHVFLRAGFSTEPRHRYAMALHVQIARDTSPSLAAAPSSRDSWNRPTLRSQIWLRMEQRLRERWRRGGTPHELPPDIFHRDEIFPRLIQPFTEMIEAHPGSPIWHLVDREKLLLELQRFERHGGPLRRIEQLFTTLTPLYYLSE